MRTRFEKNQLVALSQEAIDDKNYADQPWYGKVLRITHVATKYMPAKDFFPNRPEGYHPGFDPSSAAALYDLETIEGEPINNSLYDWELRTANSSEQQTGLQNKIKNNERN